MFMSIKQNADTFDIIPNLFFTYHIPGSSVRLTISFASNLWPIEYKQNKNDYWNDIKLYSFEDKFNWFVGCCFSQRFDFFKF